jgi:hypothetical protein
MLKGVDQITSKIITILLMKALIETVGLGIS